MCETTAEARPYAERVQAVRPDVLDACTAYYRSIHREVTPNTLSLLSACIASLERGRLADLTLQALDTNDGALAEALRTLVDAVGTGHRATPPLTLRRALGTPDATLPLFDSKTDAQMMWLTDHRYAALVCEGAAPTQSLVIGDTGLRLTAAVTAAPLPERSLPAGCIVSLVTLPTSDERTLARFRQWLSDKDTLRRIRRALYVPRGALLATLVSVAGGVQLDLPSLCPDPDRAYQAKLAEVEGFLVISSQSETHALLESARAQGFFARAFGRTNGTGTLSLSEADAVLLSLPLRLLRSLDRPRTGILRVPAKDTPPLPPLMSHATDLRPADGWQRAVAAPADTPVPFGDWTALHTTVALGKNVSHRNVSELLCRTALRLVAAGGDLDTMFVCAALSQHPDRSPRPAWLAALGLRAWSEAWRIPLADAIVTGNDGEQDTLTLCLVAKTLPRVANADHRELRLLAAPREEDGSISLSALDTLLRTASRAMREKRASAPVAWIDRAVIEGLPEGEQDEGLTDAPDAAIPQLGLLLRTDGLLAQGVRLGRVSAPASEPTEDAPPSPTVKTPPSYSAVHVAHPTVLLPVFADVDTPSALIEPLRRMGASARVLPCHLTHEDLTALADAIAACDILILNGAPEALSEMLTHRRVAHTLSARLPDHLTLALLHDAASLALPSEWCAVEASRMRRLPDGVTLEQLSDMVKYYQ